MLRLRQTGEFGLCMGREPRWLILFQGHISRDCTAPNGGPLNAAGKTCYKCGQPGHISKDCTSAETNGSAGVVPNGSSADVLAAAPAADPQDIAAGAAPTAAVA